MVKSRWIIGSVVFAFSGACSTVMSESDCVNADWQSIGEQDGTSGAPDSIFEDRFKRCSKFNIAANTEAYQLGRTAGLKKYCTPAAGFETGKAGNLYQNVCPAETEAAFLAEYELGAKLYQLTTARDETAKKHADAIRSLETNRYDFRQANTRYSENILDDVERSHLREDIEHYRREIERLEQDIPKFKKNAEEANAAYEEFQLILAMQGY